MSETTKEHHEAVALLSEILLQTTIQLNPEDLSEMTKGFVYGFAWALGVLLDPPPNDGTIVRIDANERAEAAMAYVGCKMLLDELSAELS